MSENKGGGHGEEMEMNDYNRWETHISRERAAQILEDMCGESAKPRMLLVDAVDKLNVIYDLSEQATRESNPAKAAELLNQLEDMMENVVPMQHREEFLDAAAEGRNGQLAYQDGIWKVSKE